MTTTLPDGLLNSLLGQWSDQGNFDRLGLDAVGPVFEALDNLIFAR